MEALMDVRLAHLRALLTRFARRHEYDQRLGLVTAPRGLPPELLHLIVTYIDDRRDLLSLCKSSRALYRVTQSSLYKSIGTIFPAESIYRIQGMVALTRAEHGRLYQTIRQQGISSTVTEFRIIMSNCGQHAKSSGIFKRDRTCICNNFDTLLGEALVSLENLQVLVFKCFYAYASSGKATRHRYLRSLKTRQLRRFTFRCYCNSESIARILSAPCMNTVTSLDLQEVWNISGWADLASKHCLPQLNRLMCSNISPLIICLLEKEIITHLVCKDRGEDYNLQQAVRKHPGILLHLYVQNYTHQVPISISMNPTPYLSLRHFGTITLHTDQLSLERLHETFSSLSILPDLTTLQVWVRQEYGKLYRDELHNYLLDEDLVHKISSCVPSLEKMYVQVSPHAYAVRKKHLGWLWELKYGKWVGKKTEKFRSWRIMHGEV